MIQPTILTERLCLRPFSMADFASYMLLASDFAIADTALAIPHPVPPEFVKNWIGSREELFRKGEGLSLAVETRSDQQFIGSVSLLGILDIHPRAELAYWIGRPWWNLGYGTEASQAMLEFGFTQLGLLRVFARHIKRNPASGRLMQKLGMVVEGCFRKHVRRWERVEDVVYYGILKDEFLDVREQGTATSLGRSESLPRSESLLL